MQDYGAGSKKKLNNNVRVADLAQSSLSSVGQCHQLYQLCQWLKPTTVLELGTSFGLSSAFLQVAQPNAQIVTIEGNPELVKMAAELHRLIFDQRRPKLVLGQFDKILSQELSKMDRLDMVFIDGNHNYASTVKYMQLILPLVHTESMIILHDIYWSPGMVKAWKYCKEIDRVCISIDLFHMGILLFNKRSHQKQEYTLLPYAYKPWKIGLFAD